ncbi:MAG: hypothetical protein KGI33_12575, partial [Thaumarchaeota archaeon]|nr:hypothetical protein [Nitrososphaerota archaeon]
MRLVHLFIIATLLAVPMISISTASAQNSTSIYAQNDVTLDVNTGKGHIVITGSVYKLFSYPVVLKIQSPNGTLIAVSQLKPASDGTFSLSISPSAPLWSAQGNYIITVSSDSQEIGKTTFYFNGTNLSSAPHGINTMGRLLPLEQLNTGTAANDVKCNDGLQLIIKAEDGSPACVRKETASALILRGWASQILTTETVSQANSNQTSGDVPDFKIGPYTLRLAPHQLVFFMKSNSSAKIFVEYTSRLPNTGTMNSWSR